MSGDLPKFNKARDYQQVFAFVSSVLTLPGSPSPTHLKKLIHYPDGHYRAIFSPAYFVLTEERTEASKSQWNTLKKRMKRHDPSVFVFKEHGKISCQDTDAKLPGTDEDCVYLDFGFFLR